VEWRSKLRRQYPEAIHHEQDFDIGLCAQAVAANQVEAEVGFSEVEDAHGQRAARWIRRSHPVGFLPDTLPGIVWGFERARVGHGRRVPLMMPRSFSMSSREGFWPESVRKKAGRYEPKS
jgi:hypothetical protein